MAATNIQKSYGRCPNACHKYLQANLQFDVNWFILGNIYTFMTIIRNNNFGRPETKSNVKFIEAYQTIS